MGLSQSGSASCCPGVFGAEAIVIAGTPRAGATTVAMVMRSHGESHGHADDYFVAATKGLVLPSHALERLPTTKVHGRSFELIDAGPWYRHTRDDMMKALDSAAGVVLVCDASRSAEQQGAFELLRLIESGCGSGMTPLVVLLNKADVAGQAAPHPADFAATLGLKSRRGPWLVQPCVARSQGFRPWELLPYFIEPVTYAVVPLTLGESTSVRPGSTTGSVISNASSVASEYQSHVNASSSPGVGSSAERSAAPSGRPSKAPAAIVTANPTDDAIGGGGSAASVTTTTAAGAVRGDGGGGGVALDAFPAPTPRHGDAAGEFIPLRGAQGAATQGGSASNLSRTLRAAPAALRASIAGATGAGDAAGYVPLAPATTS